MDLSSLTPNPGPNPARPTAPATEAAGGGVERSTSADGEFVPRALELSAPEIGPRDVLERSAELRAQLSELQREYASERELSAERIRELRESVSQDRQLRHEALMQAAQSILRGERPMPDAMQPDRAEG